MINQKETKQNGIATAKAKGKHLGRPELKIDVVLFADVYKQWKIGDITAVQAMNLLNMKKTSFYKNVKEYEKNKI